MLRLEGGSAVAFLSGEVVVKLLESMRGARLQERLAWRPARSGSRAARAKAVIRFRSARAEVVARACRHVRGRGGLRANRMHHDVGRGGAEG